MVQGIGLTLDIQTGLSLPALAALGTLRAWYKADSLVLNDGDAVASWTDESGNSRHAVQATGANKPLYKTNIVNGRPAIKFDGVNDFLATASFGATTQPMTIYFVAQRVGTTASGYQLADGIVVGNRMTLESVVTTGLPLIFAGASLSGIEDLGSSAFLFKAVFNGASSKISINDIHHATGSASTGTITGITLGAAYNGTAGWNGYIAEAMYFDGAVTTDNDFAIKRSLMAKYGIPYFSPLDVSGIRSWFGADRITGLRDGDPIALWLDAGPQGADLIQATGSKQPLWKKDILNHKPVVRFDGTDWMRSAAFTASSQPHTIFIVAKNDSTAAIHVLLDGIASGNRHAISYPTSGQLRAFAGSLLDSGTNEGTGYKLYSVVINLTSSATYANGVLRVSGNLGTNTITGYTVGAVYDDTLPHLGDIAEIIIYDGALSTLNRQRQEGALLIKYAL